MLRCSSSLTLLAVLLVLTMFAAVVHSQPMRGPADRYGGFNVIEEAGGAEDDAAAAAPYFMNLLKRTAVFFPNGNHDKMIKAILKSRRY